MKTTTIKICSTVEAMRDKEILENHQIKVAVIPHYKAPSFYVGDNQTSEILVREDQAEKARELLNISG